MRLILGHAAALQAHGILWPAVGAVMPAIWPITPPVVSAKVQHHNLSWLQTFWAPHPSQIAACTHRANAQQLTRARSSVIRTADSLAVTDARVTHRRYESSGAARAQVNIATRDAALAPGAIDGLAHFEGSYALAPMASKQAMPRMEVTVSSHNGVCAPSALYLRMHSTTSRYASRNSLAAT